MLKTLSEALSGDQIASIERSARATADESDRAATWRSIQPLVRAQRHQPEAAASLLRLIEDGHLPFDAASDLLAEIEAAHGDDDVVLGRIGRALEGARDIDLLNAPPPEHPVFRRVVDRLAARAAGQVDGAGESALLEGLATGARMLARQYDEVAEAGYQRLLDLDPDSSTHHFNLGLFYKTRGRFDEGMIANQIAVSLAGRAEESYQWNLGICATGAAAGLVALDVWRGMGQVLELGRFGLPDGHYPACKVRLAERPLAARGEDLDDPGLEETVWLERLSPCHGVVRSVLYQPLGVDYGDVILFDGAPITYHQVGEAQVPVFPHLATLIHSHYRLYDFLGTQDASGRIEELSGALPEDSIICSHTESVRRLCADCWRDPDPGQHAHGERPEALVVAGRIAAPAGIDASTLLECLDLAIGARPACRLLAPELCAAAGHHERAEVERRRWAMLEGRR